MTGMDSPGVTKPRRGQMPELAAAVVAKPRRTRRPYGPIREIMARRRTAGSDQLMGEVGVAREHVDQHAAHGLERVDHTRIGQRVPHAGAVALGVHELTLA